MRKERPTYLKAATSTKDSDLFFKESLPFPAKKPNTLFFCLFTVVGPTQSGKSSFIFELVKYRDVMFSEKFERIALALPKNSIHQHQGFIDQLTNEFPELEVVEGVPSPRSLGLLDDISQHKVSSAFFPTLFFLKALFISTMHLRFYIYCQTVTLKNDL